MNASGCAHVEDRGAWVLGALPPDEAADFAAHLETCLECRDEVAAMQRAADAVLELVPPTTAPQTVERRLMARVRSELRLLDAAAEDETTPRGGRRTRAAKATTAVALAVVALMTAGSFVAGRRTAPPSERSASVSVQRLVVRNTGARAAIRREGRTTLLLLDELGPPPSGRVYQVWLRRPRRALGSTNRLFSVSSRGQAIVALPPLGGVEEIVVTAEPPTGSASPTLPARLVARPGDGTRFR